MRSQPVRRSLGVVGSLLKDLNGNNINPYNDYLKINEFLLLHPVMQKRILIYWLIKHHVPFTPSQALINEIIRFFNNPDGGIHSVDLTWQIIKKKNIATIELK